MTVITYLQSYEAFKKEHINMDNILTKIPNKKYFSSVLGGSFSYLSL